MTLIDDEKENSLMDGGLKWVLANAINYGHKLIGRTLKRKKADGWNWKISEITLKEWEDYVKEEEVNPTIAMQGRRILSIAFCLLDDDNAYQIHAHKFLKRWIKKVEGK